MQTMTHLRVCQISNDYNRSKLFAARARDRVAPSGATYVGNPACLSWVAKIDAATGSGSNSRVDNFMIFSAGNEGAESCCQNHKASSSRLRKMKAARWLSSVAIRIDHSIDRYLRT